MKKNEKFLALLLSVVMILTCFVGTVTVNAENATPTATIVVTADAVEVGATEIPVTLTVTSETGINEALIKVSSDLGDIIAQPTVEANTPADADNTEGAANYNAFYLSARNVDDGTGNTTLGAITTATIKVVFTRTEAIVAGTYNVDVEIPEGKVIAASKDEVAIDLVCDGLEIVVEEPVTGPILDESITATIGAGLDDTVYMSFKINKKLLDKYADFRLAIDRKTKDDNWNLVDAETYYINKSQLGDRYLMSTTNDYWFYYRNAELFALSVMINAKVECLDADGNVVAVSNVFSSTLSSLLKTLYTTAVNANRMPMATAIADALVAGDEAVKFFTRNNTSSQFVTELDSPIKDFDTSNATKTLGELNRVNVPYNGGSAPALTLGAGVAESPFLSTYFTNLPAANNINDYAVEFSYYNPISKETVVSTTNGADMSPNAAKTRYYSYFRTLAIYASNADVTITVKYNGETLGTAHYSFDEFVAINGGHAQMGAVVTALGKLGQSFRAFKGI